MIPDLPMFFCYHAQQFLSGFISLQQLFLRHMHAFINIGLRAAREASEQIVEAWERPDRIKISEKAHNDFVTDVDTRVEQILVEHIRKAYPEHSFQCEESGDIAGTDPDTTWVIDPIDGTRNFIMGIPHFCISIACVKNGQLEHAIIVDPVKNEEFTASRGDGSQLNGQRLRVSGRKDIEGGTVSLSCAGLKNYNSLLAIQQNMQGKIGAIRMSGSAALDLAYYAAGRTDAGWMCGMNPWDVAAGILLIREAGGLISDSKGNPDCYGSDDLVFSNSKCFKDWLKIITSS